MPAADQRKGAPNAMPNSFQIGGGSTAASSRWRSSVLAITLAGVTVLASRVPAAEPSAGEGIYRRYCASCHGVEGRGDGPAASALSPSPTDLTRLHTSEADLMRLIDGRRTIRAHGTAEMPVWGEVFEKELTDEPFKQRTSLLKVHSLAQYTRGLQRPPPEK
jgi:mono/diheme cytochrome c family protein